MTRRLLLTLIALTGCARSDGTSQAPLSEGPQSDAAAPTPEDRRARCQQYMERMVQVFHGALVAELTPEEAAEIAPEPPTIEERDINDCVASTPDQQIDCVLATTTMEGVLACDPKTAPPTAEQCEAFADHLMRVMSDGPPQDEVVEGQIKAEMRTDCEKGGTVAEVECVLAQATVEEIERNCM